ncbi:pentatricopeptide repeat-containing protein At4g32450, mitochondrial-like [Rutidosis leptorrhynchoides]|uniref:pentatricopeptide repeat-containing protein At4g32450, mitochondrial-like n=1 Tax=Rutidosis leptorrhynchoides TaxID=125765 RepID=UPI003A993356
MSHRIGRTLATLKSYIKVSNTNTLRKSYYPSLKNYSTLCYTPTNDFQTPKETHNSLDFSETNSKFQFNQNPDKTLNFLEVKPQFNQDPNKSLDLCVTEPQFDQNPNKSSCLCETKPDPIVNYDNHQSLEGNRDVSGTIEELDGFCKERKIKEAVEVLGLLERNNVSVDLNRYMMLMNGCGETQSLEQGRKVHESLVRSLSSSSIDVWIFNKILDMYAKCGSVEDALKVFDKTSLRSVTCWDTMITLFARNGHGEDAIDMFTEFKRIGLNPDSRMFLGVFTACSVVGDMKEGLLHFESMSKDYDIVPSLDHYRSVVDMLGSAGYLNEALQFIEKMPMEPTVEIWETLMSNCRVHGDTELGDQCLELIELLDPTRVDEQTKAGLIPIKEEEASVIVREIDKKRRLDMSDLEDHKESIDGELRCLKEMMVEAGYVPYTERVHLDVDQESKEEVVFSHFEKHALSLLLLTSPARSPVRIMTRLYVCRDCHTTFKIISKIVGRSIVVLIDHWRIHRFENGACSCGE